MSRYIVVIGDGPEADDELSSNDIKEALAAALPHPIDDIEVEWMRDKDLEDKLTDSVVGLSIDRFGDKLSAGLEAIANAVGRRS